MPVTLAQAKLNATDDIDTQVIDEFQKNSFLLDNMTFDDVVNQAGSGSTLTYGYTRLITQADAAFRAVNTEYVPGEVTKQRYTTDLKPLGGSFQLDRILGGVAGAA
ncbi:major capsid protein, partial [Kitasatospora nipponensis]|uniref:major capsid protein n=1 Tax=Kitasatospora nipponensis TaxID=258049 RepID=UPI0031D8C565